jgi:hypothetical protein
MNTLPFLAQLSDVARLPVHSPLKGPLWTWVVPVALFAVTFIATWLLYRRFAGR